MGVKICLDAGHYDYYNQSPANKKYYESKAMWTLHLLLEKHLKNYGIEVVKTRTDQTKDRTLYDRGAASKGCNLFLSLHSNAVGSNVDDSVDYPVAYAAINGKADKIATLLTECVEKRMGTKQKARINHRKGSSGSDYYGVVRGATAVGTPGLILEHSFHTNTRSTNWLLDEKNLDSLAKAEAQVIAEYFGCKMQEVEVIYRVQVGAYSVKENAERQLEKVKAAGFSDAFIAVAKAGDVGGSLWNI